MEDSEHSVEVVAFVKEVLNGEQDRDMPVTFEDVMKARNPAHLKSASRVPAKRQI